jgi:tetratricopeptide (TPR) repeat protein
VAVGVYFLGRGNSLPAMTSAATQSPTAAVLDQGAVDALTAKSQANPQDTQSLQALANLYFDVGDFAGGKPFLSQILGYDPNNEGALVGVGLAQYNTQDLPGAESTWLKAVDLFPANAELRYYLGFLYMTTGRSDQMKAEWAKVVELAPGSTLAQTVQSQVGSLISTASPSPSGAGASPSPSGAGASPSPTGATTSPSPTAATTSPAPAGSATS